MKSISDKTFNFLIIMLWFFAASQDFLIDLAKQIIIVDDTVEFVAEINVG